MADNIYFVEVRNTFGGWSPQLYHGERPTQKRSEGGRKVFRRPPVRIQPADARFGLVQIASLYGGDHPTLGEDGVMLTDDLATERGER